MKQRLVPLAFAACCVPALWLVVQFFTSYIVRTYALILVLGNNGIINRALLQLGLVERPKPLPASISEAIRHRAPGSAVASGAAVPER